MKLPGVFAVVVELSCSVPTRRAETDLFFFLEPWSLRHLCWHWHGPSPARPGPLNLLSALSWWPAGSLQTCCSFDCHGLTARRRSRIDMQGHFEEVNFSQMGRARQSRTSTMNIGENQPIADHAAVPHVDLSSQSKDPPIRHHPKRRTTASGGIPASPNTASPSFRKTVSVPHRTSPNDTSRHVASRPAPLDEPSSPSSPVLQGRIQTPSQSKQEHCDAL